MSPDDIMVYAHRKKCKAVNVGQVFTSGLHKFSVHIVTDTGRHKTFFGITLEDSYNQLILYYGDNKETENDTDLL